MSPRLGVQLYAVKGPWADDPVGTLERIAALGIDGVEAVGVGEPNSFRSDRRERAHLLRDRVAAAGLVLSSVHTILPEPEDAEWLFEELVETGATVALASTPERVLGFPRDVFDDADRTARFADRFNDLSRIGAGHGIRVGYHTHWWEWVDQGGVPAFDRFVDALEPEVILEIDLFWAQAAGQDVATVVAQHGDRVRFVHVKDGSGVLGVPQVAAGSGEIELAEGLAAADHLEWAVLEVDLIADDADIWDVIADGAAWYRRLSPPR